MQTIKTALLSLRMLLEFPNPKDPQDAEVASMLVENPERFALVAQDWAVRYAGAPKQAFDQSKWIAMHDKSGVPKAEDANRYGNAASAYNVWDA